MLPKGEGQRKLVFFGRNPKRLLIFGKTFIAMNFIDLDFSLSYSYADYLKWTFEDRLEIIKGKLFKMCPAPHPNHQLLSVELARSLANFLRGKSCKIYTAPFD